MDRGFCEKAKPVITLVARKPATAANKFWILEKDAPSNSPYSQHLLVMDVTSPSKSAGSYSTCWHPDRNGQQLIALCAYLGSCRTLLLLHIFLCPTVNLCFPSQVSQVGNFISYHLIIIIVLSIPAARLTPGFERPSASDSL